MRSFLIAALMIVAVSACDKGGDPFSRLASVEKSVSALQQRVGTLEKSQAEVPKYVLWEVVESTQPGMPVFVKLLQAVSSFPTKDDCLNGARKLSPVGGVVVSQDPVRVQYQGDSMAFICLPPGEKPFMH